MIRVMYKVISLLLVTIGCLSLFCGCSSGENAVISPPTVSTTLSCTESGYTKPTTIATDTTETTITTTVSTTKTTVSTSKTTAETTKKTTTTHPVTTPSSSSKAYTISGVPIIPQMPNYPTGCESVSAVMALQYWGEAVSVDEFITKHLPKNSQFYWENGKKHGPNPYEFFIGDPRSTHSYGCMAPVIEAALISYFGSNKRVLNTTGQSLERICEDYIDKNQPALLWVTIGMVDTKTSDQWVLEDGTTFEWPENEHCMVLIGYDEDYYYFNDPYRGAVKKYAKWLVEKRYQQLGKQSLVITD